MRPAAFILALILLPLAAEAGRVVTSQSRQFVVYSPDRTIITDKVPDDSIIVEVDLLAMTAERVRHALMAELPALANGRDQIHLGILPSAPPNTPVAIGTTVFADGFKYRVAIPPVVDEALLVKALISVLLAEFSNRGGNRACELPVWVSEGMAQQLFFSVGPKLVVDRRSNAWEATTRDLLVRTRETLRTNAPPTFHEVTMGAPPGPKSSAEPLYHSCAHLLVQSLLHRPDGRRQFAQFLQLLPKTWNWQTAFREAFRFERMLDIEKWWALALVEFSTRDQRQAWSMEVSLQRLDIMLLTLVEAPAATNSLPRTQSMDLKTLFTEGDWALQMEALPEKINQLGYTAPHLAPRVGALALAYQKTLQSYLDKRAGAARRPGLRSTPEAQNQAFAAETLRRLADLDAKRKTLVELSVTSAR